MLVPLELIVGAAVVPCAFAAGFVGGRRRRASAAAPASAVGPAREDVDRAPHQAIVDHAAAGIVVVAPEGVVVSANAAFHRLLGYPDGALVGRHTAEFTRPDETATTREAIADLVAGRVTHVTVERQFCRADGAPCWLEVAMSAVPLADGRSGVLGIAADGTARRDASAALVENEGRLRAALAASLDAMFLLRAVRDDRGAIVDFAFIETNAAGGTLLGRAPAELTDRMLCDVYPQHRTGTLLAHLTRVVDCGEEFDEAFASTDARTCARWVWLQAVPLRDGVGGATVGVVLSARDITARTRAEAELQLLQRVTHALGTAESVDAALQTALEVLCDAVELPYGEAWVPDAADADGDSSQLVRGPVRYAHDDAAFAAFATASATRGLVPGEGVAGQAWATGAPSFVVVGDETSPDAFPRLAAARAAGIGAGLAVPVLADGEIVAVLAFFTREPHPVDAHRAAVLAAVAAQVGEVVRRKQAEAALDLERAFLAATLDSLSDGVVACDAAGRLTLFNAAARAFHGRREQPMAAGAWGVQYNLFRADGVTPLPSDEIPLLRAFRGEEVHDAEMVIAPTDQPARAIVASGRPIRATDGTLLGAVAAMRDVTAERRSESLFRHVLERLRTFALLQDATGAVTFANDALLDATGWARHDVVGRNYFSHFVPDEPSRRAEFEAAIAAGAAGSLPARRETPLRTRDGTCRLVAWDIVAFRDVDGRITGTAAIGRDVTDERALAAERERLVAELAEQADRDELTGLANRRAFQRMAVQERRRAARTLRLDAVLYVDLDGFKPINDAFGHAAGDEVLRIVARVLGETIRDADFSARIGGDEFAIYAVGISRSGEGRALAARLHAALAAHNRVARAAGRRYDIAFSVGVAEVDPDADLEAALAEADRQLYAAKYASRAAAVRTAVRAAVTPIAEPGRR